MTESLLGPLAAEVLPEPRTYTVYGITIRSEIRLTVPEHAPEPAPDVELRIAPQDFFNAAAVGVELKNTPSRWYRYARNSRGQYCLCWDDLFQFVIDTDGRTVWCTWNGATSIESLQVYLLGHALSFALTQQGHESLHATSVIVGGRAILLLGSSGYGKSSLAAAFVNAGYPLLTDDLLRIRKTPDGLLGFPGPQRLKLFPEIAERFLPSLAHAGRMNPVTDKLVVPIPHPPPAPTPLASAYAIVNPEEIGDAAEVEVAPMRPRDAAIALVRCTFNYLIDEPERLARQHAFAVGVVSRIPVFRLTYPRKIEHISSVCKAIVNSVPCYAKP